jgi:hypothetical protein
MGLENRIRLGLDIKTDLVKIFSVSFSAFRMLHDFVDLHEGDLVNIKEIIVFLIII